MFVFKFVCLVVCFGFYRGVFGFYLGKFRLVSVFETGFCEIVVIEFMF